MVSEIYKWPFEPDFNLSVISSLRLTDNLAKFKISDEVLNGRPLYLDAQATSPLVSFILSLLKQ